MKRVLILVLVALMCAAGALAEMPTEMRIVNCEEWVSLRAEPDSASQRFAEVKLGETVRGYYGSNGEFTQCEYDGVVGYILTEYLEVAGGVGEAIIPQTPADAEYALEGGCVRVWKDYGDASETMTLARYDAQDQLIWSYATESLGTTELSSVEAFINDKAAQPMVMAYNSYFGLVALDAETGEKIWTLPCSEVSLGASISYAVADDGTMYIGGYYGPDPAAISADGKLMWQATQTDTDFYWICEITPTEDGIAVTYEGEPAVVATYDAQGNLTGHEPAPAA